MQNYALLRGAGKEGRSTGKPVLHGEMKGVKRIINYSLKNSTLLSTQRKGEVAYAEDREQMSPSRS